MNTLPTIAVVELERAILSSVVTSCETIIYKSSLKEDCTEIKDRLRAIMEENSIVFSVPFYQDVHLFYQKEILAKGKYPSFFAINQYFQSHPRYEGFRNHAYEHLKEISEASLANAYPLDYMIAQLKQDSADRRVQQLAAEIIQEKIPDIKKAKYEELKSNLAVLSGNEESQADTIKRIVQQTSAMDGLEKLMLKRKLRQQYGLTPQEVEEALQVSGKKRQIPTVTRLCDFLGKDFGPSNWIYAGILPANSLTLLVGDSGAGKTILAYECLLSYLDSKSFLGEPASVLADNPKKRGLIINSDQPPQQAQEILLNQVRSSSVAQHCEIVEYGWCLEDLPQLELLIQQCGYTFVVVDSYIGIHKHLPGFDENSTYARIAVEKLQEIAFKYGVTILAIHHSNKSADNKGIHKASGNKFITSTASCQWNLCKSAEDSSVKNFSIPKIRNSQELSYVLQFDPLTCTHNVVSGLDKRVHQIADNIYRLLFRNNKSKLSFADIQKNFPRTSNTTGQLIHKSLFLLEQRGLIRKEQHPSDPSLRIFSLREPPQEALPALIQPHILEEMLEKNF